MGNESSEYIRARQIHEDLLIKLGELGVCILTTKLLVREAGADLNPAHRESLNRFIFPPQEIALTDDNSSPGSDHDPNFIVDGEFLRYGYDKDKVRSIVEIVYDERPDSIGFGAIFVQGEDMLGSFVQAELSKVGLTR